MLGFEVLEILERSFDNVQVLLRGPNQQCPFEVAVEQRLRRAKIDAPHQQELPQFAQDLGCFVSPPEDIHGRFACACYSTRLGALEGLPQPQPQNLQINSEGSHEKWWNTSARDHGELYGIFFN